MNASSRSCRTPCGYSAAAHRRDRSHHVGFACASRRRRADAPFARAGARSIGASPRPQDPARDPSATAFSASVSAISARRRRRHRAARRRVARVRARCAFSTACGSAESVGPAPRSSSIRWICGSRIVADHRGSTIGTATPSASATAVTCAKYATSPGPPRYAAVGRIDALDDRAQQHGRREHRRCRIQRGGLAEREATLRAVDELDEH